ncbi:putative chemotactic signal-response protein CheL [Gluconacetobacter diazotrophicus PA1 5]|uniref:rod-binding protein n=1 Tax=Gluconacetobacter diazotrophicus TaxID=33996 RepID=UPI000173CA89|nr:rod-binding protein [Gluconacetobacter diazotrophicus]ACI53158.1 putative chemotactic signal-response protein CheL [Gluconacetobacter diazotrophicus PA1 5]
MSIGSIAASLSSVQQQLSPAPSAKDTRTAEQAHKAAVEFEGLTIGELIQPMFDTVDTTNDMFGGGAAESQFRSLQVSEMGKKIANSGGIGLADSVYRQMLAMQEKAQS